MISSKTSFLALIGNPIEHSLSPIMHNAVLEYLNLDLIYIAIPCKKDDFNLVIKALSKINCRGVNITIPYKEKAFEICDEVSSIAKRVKAINTIKITSSGKLIGTNTDIEGFCYPLKKINLKNKQSIILGSGGAARSAVQGLINKNSSEITIVSRNKLKIEKIKSDFEDQFPLKTILNTEIDLINHVRNADLIINTTPVGMKNNINKSQELPFGENIWECLNSKTILYDLIYNPRETPLIKIAKQKGCLTISGEEMLIAQGAESLSYWTNHQEIPINVMKKVILNYL